MQSAKQTPPTQPVHIVLDIDGTLATCARYIEPRGSQVDFKGIPQNQIIRAGNLAHYVHHGVCEFIRYLFSLSGVRVSFFSAGAAERNLPFVEQLLRQALGAPRYEEIKNSVSILSREQMLKDQLPKDLRLILQHQNSSNPSDLSQVVLLDDSIDAVYPGQHRNLLKVPFLLLGIFKLDDRNALKLFRMNHIFYMAGLLNHILNHIPVTRELYELQFDLSEKNSQLFLSKRIDVQRNEFYHAGLAQLQVFNPELRFYQQDCFIPWLNNSAFALQITEKELKEYHERDQQKKTAATAKATSTTTALATTVTPPTLPRSTLAPNIYQVPAKDLVEKWKSEAKNGNVTAQNQLAAHYRFTNDADQLLLLFRQYRQNPTVIFHAGLNNQLQKKLGILEAFGNLARGARELFISLFLQENAPSFALLNQLLKPIMAKLIAAEIRYYEIVLTNRFFAQPFGIAGRLICEYFFEHISPDERYKSVVADIREKSVHDLMTSVKASLDDPQCHNELGDHYFAMSARAPQYRALAFDHYCLAASANNTEALCRLGYLHEHMETEREKNQKMAIDYYSKAAENGLADAQEYLGDCYQQGRLGLKRDDKMAVELYRKAAEQHHPNAICKLSFCYRYGLGVPERKEYAETLLKHAETEGQFRYSPIHPGIPCDNKNEIDWYHGAAEQGYYIAQVELAYMYLDGVDVAKDFAKAALYLRRAAEQKSSEYSTEKLCADVFRQHREHPSIVFHMVMALKQTTGDLSKEYKDAFVAASLKFPDQFQAMLNAENPECRTVAESFLEQANTTRVRPANDAPVSMANVALMFSSSANNSMRKGSKNDAGYVLGMRR